METAKTYKTLYKTTISYNKDTKQTIYFSITEVISNSYSSFRYQITFNEEQKKASIVLVSRKDFLVLSKKLEKIMKDKTEKEEVIELSVQTFKIKFSNNNYVIYLTNKENKYMYFVDIITLKCIYDQIIYVYNNFDLINLSLNRKNNTYNKNSFNDKKNNFENKKNTPEKKKSTDIEDIFEEEEDMFIPSDEDEGFFDNLR